MKTQWFGKSNRAIRCMNHHCAGITQEDHTAFWQCGNYILSAANVSLSVQRPTPPSTPNTVPLADLESSYFYICTAISKQSTGQTANKHEKLCSSITLKINK